MKRASRAPRSLKAMRHEMITIPATRNANGGGVRSQCWNTPRSASIHVASIHATAAIPTRIVVRHIADNDAPLRCQAAIVANVNVTSSRKGMTTNARLAGSA